MNSSGRVLLGVGAVAILLGVAALVCSTLDSVTYQTHADEGFYHAYASRVAAQGPAGFSGIFRDYLHSSQVTRYFPNPLRVLTISLGAIAMKLGGGPYYTNLSLLSLAAFLGLLGVMFAGTGRAFGWRTAVWTLLLAAAAPLHLALARRALSDTLISAFLVGSLWLLLRALWPETESPPRRWVPVALAFAGALLVKESAFLLMPMALFFLVWKCFQSGRPLALWPLLAVTALPLLLAGAVMALAAGGVGEAWRTATVFSGAASLSGYAAKNQSGPWYRFLVDLMLISPWPVLCWLAWIGALIAGRTRDGRLWFWALVPALFIGMASLMPAGKNPRFVLFAEMPMRLCTVLLLQRATRDAKGNLGSAALMAAAVGGIVWMDLNSFRELFVAGGIYDPVGATLLIARGFLPR